MKPTLILALSLITAFSILTSPSARACDPDKLPARDKTFLENIFISSVDFEDIPLQVAIDFVACKAIELDTSDNPKIRGVSIRWIRESDLTQTTAASTTKADPRAEPDLGPPINYIAYDVSALTILQELAKQAHCDLHVTTIGVFLTPAGKLPSEHPKYPGARIRETLYRYEAGEN